MLLTLPLPTWMRALRFALPWRWLPRGHSELNRGQALRLALEDLPAAELWRAHAEGADDARLRQRFGPGAAGFPDWLAQQAVAGSGAL